MLKIEHVALWVEDLEATRQFYADWFGASAGEKYYNPNKGFESYFLSFGSGARLEIMRRVGMQPRPVEGSAPLAGWAHIALSLGSEAAVDALSARMREAGVPLIDGPRRTGDGYYESVVLDPEGNRVEITV